MMVSINEVLQTLANIVDQGSGHSIIELGWISRVKIQNHRVVLRLELPEFANTRRDIIVREARQALLSLDDTINIQVELGTPSSQSSSNAPIGQAGHGTPSTSNTVQAINGVENIIVVSSGKGGVGKSTVAVNLACALAHSGLKVGLLDADIYGPNAPTMLGVSDLTPEIIGSGNNQILKPIQSCGITIVSMGLLIDKKQPVIWRGPMLNGIIRQFLYQVAWENRDVLIIDLPPGTGDVQLSITQAVPITGALVVTTPQIVSLQDARRGLAMFTQMGVNILGVIENMSMFIPPDQPSKRYPLFGIGGGAILAEEADVKLLCQLPLEIIVQQGSDRGQPVVIAQPASATGQVFLSLADKIKLSLLKT
ncbi:MRP protein-like protein (chromatophore) [Paulinella micropora]|uniref:MRP protein-like protein n=2 Tax=Paulinella micropora TaxID=1928728 RepID=A0A5K7W0A8_9EUKA|nr:MRP protein-like protein [Paulinella micropora]